MFIISPNSFTYFGNFITRKVPLKEFRLCSTLRELNFISGLLMKLCLWNYLTEIKKLIKNQIHDNSTQSTQYPNLVLHNCQTDGIFLALIKLSPRPKARPLDLTISTCFPVILHSCSTTNIFKASLLRRDNI
jgi:hypothetical protein